MVERTLRLLALAACAVLLLSLGLFAIDQSGQASQQAQSEVNGSGAQAVGPALSAGPNHGTARRAVDDAADTLIAPVAGLLPGRKGDWGYHLWATGLGLLLYGLVLGMIARSLGLARLGPPREAQTWSSSRL